ncbi:MAG TPA: SUMF1/EgtB/PvdO family nonheme iron enzyme [Phnomibacter sp.]|nr:SUMF1/EgtB/PvdO family nonheme iron enzyme [Phnomibacter sp.]
MYLTKIGCTHLKVLLFAACMGASVCSIRAQETLEHKIPGCSTVLKLRKIPAGSFTMGSAEGEPGRNMDEGPQRKVQVSSFYMSVYETTWEQYNAFFQDENFSRNVDADAITRPSSPYLDFTLGMGKDGFPANSMQQYGALMFCKWLYQQTGVFYRLPTEAEWEYACRAGTATTWPTGNDSSGINAVAWNAANSQQKYQPVGKLQPNAFGLYDMQGNVSEWVLDQYDSTYFNTIQDGATDPQVKPTKRNPRTIKGGSFADHATELRPANRTATQFIWNRRDPQIPKSKWWNTDAPFIGFRVVKPIPQPSPEEAAAFFTLYIGK